MAQRDRILIIDDQENNRLVIEYTGITGIALMFEPLRLALGAGATFVGRTVDLWGKHTQAMIKAAHAHKGASFIEILQNCIIFNDGAFDDAVAKKTKAEQSVDLVHGQPITFAKGTRGLRLNGLEIEAVELGNGITEDDLLVHDATNLAASNILASMEWPELPVPTGILRQVDGPSYHESLEAQVSEAQLATGGQKPSLDGLFRKGDTWTVN